MVPLAPSDFHVKKLQLTSIIELWRGRPARAKPGKEKRKKKERKKERTKERKKERKKERNKERKKRKKKERTLSWLSLGEAKLELGFLIGVSN